MKFGVIPAYMAAPVEEGEFTAGFGQLIEEMGFESVWPVEHVVMPEDYSSRYPYDESGRMPIPDAPIPDPFIWNTWLAATTRRLRLASAMAILPQHNPVVFAKQLASLDVLSGGRVILGAGIGWLREEAEACGTKFTNRGRRTDEYIEAMKALWTHPVASYQGEHVSFDAVKCNPMPVQKGGIPIHIGGHSAAAARRAGRLGDGFLPLGGALEELGKLWKIVEATAREHGRDPSAIELSYVGGPVLESAQAVQDAGAARMLVASRARDLEGVKRSFGDFADKIIPKFS